MNTNPRGAQRASISPELLLDPHIIRAAAGARDWASSRDWA
jgi:hypothetical protein